MTRRRALVGLALAVVVAGATAGVVRRAGSGPFLNTVTLSGQVTALALDARTGRLFVATTSVDGGRGHVDVLDASSGALLRSVAVGPSPAGVLVDERTNRVFAGDSADWIMRVLDASSGALLRSIKIGYMPGGVQGAVLDARTNRLFVWASGVQMLDARTGAVLRTILNVGNMLTLDAQTGRVFDEGGGPSAIFDARTGATVGTIRLGKMVIFDAPSPPSLVVGATGRRLYIGGITRLAILDGRGGRLMRSVALGRTTPAPNVLPANLLVLGEVAGRVVVDDPNSQRVSLVDIAARGPVRKVVLGRDAIAPALDARAGRVFLAGDDLAGNGQVWMFDARTGALLRTTTIAPDPVSVVLDQRSGRVFVASRGDSAAKSGPGWNGPGRLSVLDARSGALLRTVPLPGGTMLAVDARTGRAFVVEDGGSALAPDPFGWLPPWLRYRVPFLPPPPSGTRLFPGTISVLDATR